MPRRPRPDLRGPTERRPRRPRPDVREREAKIAQMKADSAPASHNELMALLRRTGTGGEIDVSPDYQPLEIGGRADQEYRADAAPGSAPPATRAGRWAGYQSVVRDFANKQMAPMLGLKEFTSGDVRQLLDQLGPKPEDHYTLVEKGTALAGQVAKGFNAPALGLAEAFGPAIIQAMGDLQGRSQEDTDAVIKEAMGAARGVADPSIATLGKERHAKVMENLPQWAVELASLPGFVLNIKGGTRGGLSPASAAAVTSGLSELDRDPLHAAASSALFMKLGEAVGVPLKAALAKLPIAHQAWAVRQLAHSAEGAANFATAGEAMSWLLGHESSPLKEGAFGALMHGLAGKRAPKPGARPSAKAEGRVEMKLPEAGEAPDPGKMPAVRWRLKPDKAAEGRPAPEAPVEPVRAPEAPARAEAAPEPAPKPKAEPALVEAPKPKPAEGAAAQEGTSVKNEVMNRERAERGLDPIERPDARPQDPVAAKAAAEVRENPRRPQELMEELDRTGRAHKDSEVAVLDVHRVNLRDSRARADAEGMAAAKRGDTEAAAAAKAKADDVLAELAEVDRIGRSSGAETARGLAFRKRMMRDDYSLAEMEVARSRQQDYKPLSEKQKAETKELHDRLQAATKERDAYKAKLAEVEATKAIDAVIKPPARRHAPSYKSPEFGAENKGVTREAKAAARKKIDDIWAGRGTLGAGPGAKLAELIPEYVKIGRFYIEGGIRGALRWRRAMVEDLGERVKPYLSQIWAESKNGLAPLLTSETAAKMKASAGKGKSVADMHRQIGELAEGFVRTGITDREKLIDAVHEVVAGIDPAMTRRQTMDALSGYGRMKALDLDPAKVTLRELKGQALQIAKLEDMAAGKAPLKTGIERQSPGDEQRRLIGEVNEAKKRGGYDATDPATQLKTALASVKTRLKNQIADIQRQLKTGKRDTPKKSTLEYDAEAKSLRDQRDALKKTYNEVFGKRGLTNEQRLKAWKTRTENRINEMERRMESGDFSPRSKPEPIKLDERGIRLEARVNMVTQKFREAMVIDRLKNRSRMGKIIGGTAEALNLSKALVTSLDFSAVLRQGAMLVASHPVMAAKSLPNMFRAFRGERAQARSEAEIRSRANYESAKKAGLDFTETGPTASIAKMEENMNSRLAEKIPLVAGSQRAYTVFLNRLRMDVYDAMAASLSNTGTPTKVEAKAIASFINKATGRGTFGQRSQALSGLSTVFWAPRLAASRFQLLGIGAKTAADAATGFRLGDMKTRRVRKLIAMEYARSLIGVGIVYSLAELSGGDVEKDPRSSDFGKIRYGDTRVDPLAGLAQATVLLTRLGMGETKRLSDGRVVPLRGEGTPFGSGTMSTLGRFLRSKLAPITGSMANIVDGKDFLGRDVTPGTVARDLMIPLSMRDIYEAMQAHGVPRGAALGLLATFGMGLQNFDTPKKPGRKRRTIRRARAQSDK